MNAPDAELPPKSPGLPRRLMRRFFSLWMLKRCLFALAVLVTLIGLVWAVENWRGRRALERYQGEWMAKGERFDRASVIPPVVPDDQNLAAIPMFARLFDRLAAGRSNNAPDPEAAKLQGMTLYHSHGRYGTNTTGNLFRLQRCDLRTWQDYYRNPPPPSPPAEDQALRQRYGLTAGPVTNLPTPPSAPTNEFPVAALPQTPAQDVLLALSRYDAVLEELHRAGARPYVRFPAVAHGDLMTDAEVARHLPALKALGQVTRLRAIAWLADHQPAQAYRDMRLMFRLSDALGDEPYIISFLVRIACHAIVLQPFWEGMLDHRWTADQLLGFQTYFESLDFFTNYYHVIRGERNLFQITALPRQTVSQAFGPDAQGAEGLTGLQRMFRHMPKGWLYQNQLSLFRMHEACLAIKPSDSNESFESRLGRFYDERRHPYRIFAGLLAPAVSKVFGKAKRIQSHFDLATVACALERYYLQNHAYPETIHALVPRYLASPPADIYTGEPLHYRRTAPDRFLLYSVGEDLEDNDGTIQPPPETVARDPKLRWDFVWTFPPAP